MRINFSSKWLGIIALTLITLTATFLASTKASLEYGTNPRNKTEDLILLFQEAQTSVAKIFRKFENATQNIPEESLNHYNNAILLAEESKKLLENGRYSEADNKVIQALQELKEALQILYSNFPISTPETDLEKAAQMKNTLYRYNEQIMRIENLTKLYAAQEFDTTSLEADILCIKSLFDEATINIEKKNFEEASTSIAEVEDLFNKLLNKVSEFATDLNTERLQTYINQSETRIASIREKAELQLNTDSLTALNEAQNSLDNAKDFLQNQQINETLSELVSSKESEEKALEYLQPSVSSIENTSRSMQDAVQVP